MNRRSIILILSAALSLTLLCCAFVQRSKLNDLRAQEQQRHSDEQVAAQPPESSNVPGAASPTPAHAVSAELLKLRNAVSQLTRRRDELASIGRENERLKGQLASRATNGPSSSTYLRKADAKFSGYDTPEHTLQTFLWALQNKDFETWLNTLAPNVREPLQKAQQQGQFSADDFFRGTDDIPGFVIVSLESMDSPLAEPANDAAGEREQVKAQVQIGPGVPPWDIPLRRINGQWQIVQFFNGR